MKENVAETNKERTHTLATHFPFAKQIMRGKVDNELVDENGFYLASDTKDEVIRRYNCHEELLETLKAALHDYINGDGMSVASVRIAIAKAEGK